MIATTTDDYYKNEIIPSVIYRLREKTGTGENIRAVCPFCDSPKKTFYFNRFTGQYKCYRENNCSESGNAWDLHKFFGLSHQREKAAPTPKIFTPAPKKRKPISYTPHYIYNTPEGKPVLGVSRFYDKATGKKFTPPAHFYNGRWYSGYKDFYNSPLWLLDIDKFSDKDFVIINEGEKKARNLQRILPKKWVSTSTFGGSEKEFSPENIPYLSGKTVFIFSDNDDTGKLHAIKIYRAIKEKNQDAFIFNPGDYFNMGESTDIDDWLKLVLPEKPNNFQLETAWIQLECILNDVLGGLI